MKKLKLYVWENVLRDWADGIMFAYATDRDHAREMLLKKCNCVPDDTLRIEPREIKEAEGFVLWGGA